jgi:DNA-binding NtrC family response regulator
MKDELRLRFLIVDDEQSIRRLCMTVGQGLGFLCTEAETAEAALESLESMPPDIVVTDLKLPSLSGADLLRRVKEQLSRTEIAIMTGHGSIESAVEAMRLGAYDYIEKPFRVEKLRQLLQRMAEKVRLVTENQFLRERVNTETQLDGIVGTSAKIQDVMRMISRLKDTRTPVLITGESGTGKELVARAMHFRGPLAPMPFVAVDCGALVPTLMESELFGHEKGAFTGATSARRGKFELADGVTLFLDEVGDLHGSSQAKLLRVLQEGEFHRVGGEQSISVSVRVISATNRDLSEMVAQQKFREDLYYRLCVMPVRMPALRERVEDIRPLAEYFLGEFCARNNFRPKRFEPDAIEALEQYGWPGNIRELRNVVERMAILARGDAIEAGSVPAEIRLTRSAPPRSNLRETRESAERDHILRALQDSDWNVSGAARALGMERTNLHKRIRALGIERDK